MKVLAQSLLAEGGLLSGLPRDLAAALLMFAVGGVVVFGFVLLVAGVTSWVERRVWARIQSRVGPNRVGPQGILQWLADGVKNLLKEDVIPVAADRLLFVLAPYVVVAGFTASFVAIPFAASFIVADLDIGVLYITAVTSLVVAGILMAGWASNNKWSLLGGMRSAAQIVSYEVPAALSIFPVVLMGGTLSMQGIIGGQGAAPWNWYLFNNPFSFVAFFTFFIAALAEGNRTPFDLPEAETELVAGYCTEYSGMRALLFYLAEWGNLYVVGALVTTLFLGGWQVPRITENVFLLSLLQFLVFFAKSYFFVFVAMWIRATLPRIRVDQLMVVCWKYLVPISFFNVAGTAVWLALVGLPGQSALASGTRWVMMGVGFLLLVVFARRVVYHIRRARPELYFSPVI